MLCVACEADIEVCEYCLDSETFYIFRKQIVSYGRIKYLSVLLLIIFISAVYFVASQ